MRRSTWLLIGLAMAVAIGALAVWVPSRLAERQVTEALRPHIDPTGSLSVQVRTTALDYPRGRIRRLDVDARGIKIADLTAEGLTASMKGVTLTQSTSGALVVRARAGHLTVTIAADDLKRFLRTRGVQNPEVAIDAAGVKASGMMRVGAVEVAARLSGQFEGSGRDLRFRVTSLDVGGVELPPAVAGTVFGTIQPSWSLESLPFPVEIDRISTSEGRVVVTARVVAP
ncbi:MAG: LmeA family phospholipid-binding protein [Armatimonadota bacterium]